MDLIGAGELTAVVDFLAPEVERLARAGADFALLAANTPHLVFDELQGRVRVPMISIVEATADAAAAAKLHRLALLGTRFTMQAKFYPQIFARKQMEIVVPSEAEQEFIHRKYMGELLIGVLLDETRDGLLQIIDRMKQRENVEAVILGGTELSLILRAPTAAGLPVLDTTQIHVDAAIDRLLAH